MYALIVTEPFADYAKGAVIRDAAAMEAAQKDNPHRVVRVAADAIPGEPSASAAPAFDAPHAAEPDA